MSKVSFNNKQNFFFSALNAKVETYFRETNLKKTGNINLYFKSFVLITVAASCYMILLTVSLPDIISISLCSVFGFALACIGFNVMHDANHGSYSTKKWVNNLMGLTANMIGVNAWMWKQKHNIIHHTYTNVNGVDDDLSKSSLLRLCPSQKQLKIHRYQYIYCIPLYGLTSLFWTFFTDFTKYFKRRIHGTAIQKMEVKEHIIFWLSKVLYVFFYMALPIYIVGFLPFIIGFLIVHITLGITLAIVFQLAHVVEATHFADASLSVLKINQEWAIHQVQTTADFATNNKIISWLTGGLNFQVEHHLFPKISHVHYPVIRQFVKETCQKFSVRYNDYPSMLAALISHLRFLKQLGAQ
ncbi:MAG: acyl-CoA desaturase [Bacteroidia bacterium]